MARGGLLLLAGIAGLGGCGRRGDPEPPEPPNQQTPSPEQEGTPG